MKKKLLVALATVLSAAAVLAGGIAASGDGGTVVDRGFDCAVYDGNGVLFITNNSTLTVFGSKAVLRCSGVGDPGPGPWPTYFNFGNTGLPCGMGDFGLTTNWTDKVGYNGLSQLVCVQALPLAAGSSSAGYGIGG